MTSQTGLRTLDPGFQWARGVTAMMGGMDHEEATNFAAVTAFVRYLMGQVEGEGGIGNGYRHTQLYAQARNAAIALEDTVNVQGGQGPDNDSSARDWPEPL